MQSIHSTNTYFVPTITKQTNKQTNNNKQMNKQEEPD